MEWGSQTDYAARTTTNITTTTNSINSLYSHPCHARNTADLNDGHDGRTSESFEVGDIARWSEDNKSHHHHIDKQYEISECSTWILLQTYPLCLRTSAP